MTLTSMIRTYDETALEAVSSKGLVRRALRDLESGLVDIIEMTDQTATLRASGQNVFVTSKGLEFAQCDCPARGVCRHIVLAILKLRAENRSEPAAHEASGRSALGELCLLGETDIEKSAGKDWQKAIRIASGEEAREFTEQGPNCLVALPRLGCTVMFIAGQGLRGAIYKGPKSRRRLIVTACAIIARGRCGIGSELVADPPAPALADPDYLQETGKMLERAVQTVLPGRSALAADLLLDLSIAIRTEALPRLAAQLRDLARQAELAADREHLFEAEVFLKDAARTYALVEALKHAPGDPALTGSSSRDYRPSPSCTLWTLGASRWRSAVGARGVSVYCYVPDSRSWLSSSQGRSAGSDPGFDARSLYFSPLFNAIPMRDAMARVLSIEEPRISGDGAVSPVADPPATLVAREIPASTFFSAGAAIDSWRTLRSDLEAQFGNGLRRRHVPLPLAILPRAFRGLAFDELEQRCIVEVLDRDDQVLSLTFTAEDADTAKQLYERRGQFTAIVVEARLAGTELLIRPVSLLGDNRGVLTVHNLDFDHWSREGVSEKALRRLQKAFSQSARPVTRQADRLAQTLDATVDAAIAIVEHTPVRDADALIRRCDALGLTSLGQCVRKLFKTMQIRDALAVSYLASEAEIGNALQM